MNYKFEPWTWKETLWRLQYINKVMDGIVRGGILFNAGLLLLFLVLSSLLYSKGMTLGQIRIFHTSLVVSGLIGIVVNLFIFLSIARQQYMLKWYFALLPEDKFPFEPNEKWIPENFRNIQTKRALVAKYVRMNFSKLKEFLRSIRGESKKEALLELVKDTVDATKEQTEVLPPREENEKVEIHFPKYSMDYMDGEEIKEASDSLWMITLGKLAPEGYKLWFYAFIIMIMVFIILAIISWYL